MNVRNQAMGPTSLPLRRRALLGAVGGPLGGVLLSACGGTTGAQAPDASPAVISGPIVSTSVNVPSNGPLSALIAASPPAAAPRDPAAPITRADQGTTINLPVGMQTLLALDGNYDWTVTVDDPSVLAPVT